LEASDASHVVGRFLSLNLSTSARAHSIALRWVLSSMRAICALVLARRFRHPCEVLKKLSVESDPYVCVILQMRRRQRYSREGLIQEARDVLTQAGVHLHMRAEYLKYLSAEVVLSDNPLFVRLQPNVHAKNTIAWAQSYGFLFQYLTWFELTATLATIETESFESIPQIPVRNPDGYFDELFSPRATVIPFKDRVNHLVRTRLKRPAQTPSPRVAQKRGGKPQTPLQKRPTRPPKSGRTTPIAAEKHMHSPILTITSPRKKVQDSLESEDMSDIIVTEVIEKPRRKK
jgi:hypothetical protein